MFEQQRIEKIQSAKKALEKRETTLNPDQPIEDKNQVSFADHDAQIMGKKGVYDCSYNGQVVIDSDNQIIVAQHTSQNANDLQKEDPALKALDSANINAYVATD